MMKYAVVVAAAIGALTLEGCKGSDKDQLIKLQKEAVKGYDKVNTEVSDENTKQKIHENCAAVEKTFLAGQEKLFKDAADEKKEAEKDGKVVEGKKSMEEAKTKCFQNGQAP